jgi:signal transduction histidine kinase
MSKPLSLKNILILGGISIIAVMGVGIGTVIVNDMRQTIIDQRFNELEISQEIKKSQLKRYLEFRLKDISLFAKTEGTVHFVQELLALHDPKDDSAKIKNYFGNLSLQELFKHQDAYYKEYAKTYEFHDIFIIEPEHGHILYTAAKESDLGESLKFSDLKNSKLGETYREVLRTDRLYLSDMELYGPSGKKPAMFVGAPIHDHNGKLIAVAACQLSDEKITDLVAVVGGDLKSKEIYLIGQDHLPRSNTLVNGPAHMLISAFEHPSKGRIDTESVNKALTGEKGRAISVDFNGRQVISVYSPVIIENLHWGIVGKVDLDEVEIPIKEQMQKIIYLIVICSFVAFLLSMYVIRIIINNINNLSSDAQKLSRGDFESIHNYSLYQELQPIGTMLEEQKRILSMLSRDVNGIKTSVAENNLEVRIDAKQYPGDFLYIAGTINTILSLSEDNLWIKRGIADLLIAISEKESLEDQANEGINALSRYLNAGVTSLYLYDEAQQLLERYASYAYVSSSVFYDRFRLGEGSVGQVALDHRPIILDSLSVENSLIATATAMITPYAIYIYPLLYKEKIIGVFEMASQEVLTKTQLEFLVQALESFSVTLYATQQSDTKKNLLFETLEQKTELQTQSEELMQSNIMLEEQQQKLETLSQDLQIRNDQLEKSQNELIIKADDLERSNRYKSEFLANTSHELRTPLNAIILLSKLLGEEDSGKLGEENIKKANIIHKSGNDLLRLINDILDLSKIESGKMEIESSTFSTNEITMELKDMFDYIANDKGIVFEVDDHYSGMMTTDRSKLMQILKNLLSNAFKFTNQGKVSLKLQKSPQDEMNIEIAVGDTGIGIDDEKQRFIFEPFRQADGSTSRKYGGTGLGLSISKELIKILGGEIFLQSTPNVGSLFTITLPLGIPAQFSVEQTEIITKQSNAIVIDNHHIFQNTPKVDLSGKKILIVDDDARNIFALSALFEQTGAYVHNAFNGIEALDFLREREMDIVLMDIMMPEMDGYEAISKIRHELGLLDLPIIAVTAKTMKEDRQKCMDAGASDYLTKPVDFDALVMMVKGWVNRT